MSDIDVILEPISLNLGIETAIIGFSTESKFGFSMGNHTNMPNNWISKHLNSYNSERRLFDKLISESIKQHGVCLYYYVTTWDTSYDKIWGEDNNRRFERYFQFNGFYTLPREDKTWSKFGITGMDTFSIFVAKLHFDTVSRYNYNRTSKMYQPYIPKVGDIVMADYNKHIYEITEVKEEVGMFLLSKQHMWEFVVRPYKDEHIDMSPDTSATMGYMQNYSGRNTDNEDIKTEIDINKNDIKYTPKNNEMGSNDPFAGW